MNNAYNHFKTNSALSKNISRMSAKGEGGNDNLFFTL